MERQFNQDPTASKQQTLKQPSPINSLFTHLPETACADDLFKHQLTEVNAGGLDLVDVLHVVAGEDANLPDTKEGWS